MKREYLTYLSNFISVKIYVLVLYRLKRGSNLSMNIYLVFIMATFAKIAYHYLNVQIRDHAIILNLTFT